MKLLLFKNSRQYNIADLYHKSNVLSVHKVWASLIVCFLEFLSSINELRASYLVRWVALILLTN